MKENNSARPIFVVDAATARQTFMGGRDMVVKASSPGELENLCLSGVSAFLYVLECRETMLDALDSEAVMRVARCCPKRLRLEVAGLGDYLAAHGLLMSLNGYASIIYHGASRCRDARITASLGIDTGVAMIPDMEIGEELSELCVYNFYGKMTHGAIEPFATIQLKPDRFKRMSPAMAMLENPSIFFYVDAECRVALREADLRAGNFIGAGPDLLDALPAVEEVERAAHGWQRFFITPHVCASCPAFRICSGYFEQQAERGDCRAFMCELLEGMEFSHGLTAEG